MDPHAKNPEERSAVLPGHEPKPVSWTELPENLRRALSSLPMHEWGSVVVSICPSELMMDAADLVAAFARVWEKSKAAEDFRIDRLPGDEREKFRKEFEEKLKGIAAITIRLGVRSRLYGELQLMKELLTRYAQDVWQSSWTKAMSRSVHENGASVHSPRPAQARRPNPASPKETPQKPTQVSPKGAASLAVLPGV